MTWYGIFPKILNMSLTASVIICFVLLCRLLLKKAPKIYSYALWSVVLFRLLCPVTLSAPVSVLGIFDRPVVERMMEEMNKEVIVTSSMEYIPSDIVHTEYPEVTVPAPVVGEMISDAVNEKLPQGEEQLRADPLEAPVTIFTYLWMAGILVLLTYVVISYVKLRQSLLGALKLRDNIYMADHISGPFVLGIIRPKIYLPSGLEKKEQAYIVLHEQHHIRRGDPVFKMLAFLALCIHWFNPLVWIAFRLAEKDMEMSCDEAVIRKLGEKVRADYSASLLQLATGQRILFGSPLAFGEGEPAGRIRNLARFKRPRIVMTVVASLVCAVGILVCIFNPAAPEDLLRMTEQHSDVNGNRVKYEVEFGNQVGSAILYAEQWIDGTCTRSSQVILTKNVKLLQVLMKERKNDGVLSGIDIQIDTEEVAGSLLTYFAFPEEHTTVGWAFKAYEEKEKLKVVPGEEKILAVMVFDEGDGVRVFDCETLQSEPERIENADHMILVRAVFNEEVVEESRTEEAKEQSGEEQSVATEENAENANETQEVNADINEAETYSAQWKLIAQQKDVWHTYMDYANDLQQYTIADLDGNGRLEVIVSSMGGTGSYSYTRFYEVTESFDELVECTTDFVEGDSQPDFVSINEPGQVFLDADGMLHYLIRDFMRVGTEYYNTIYGVVLKDGHITHQTLAQMYESYSSGSSVIEYYNTKGEKITEAEYLSAAENAFAGMSALTYTFDWRKLEEIEDADAEEIYTILSEIRSGIIRSNGQMTEEHGDSVILRSETTDFWSTAGMEVWMESFAPELESNIFYVTVLDQLENFGLLPDGSEAYVAEGEAFGNSVAFQDVDMDGQKELLLNVGGTCMADMGIYVYQFDESLDGVFKFRKELVVWPAETFYSNGIVIAKWSHNHGYSDTDKFWPYDVYSYSNEIDEYVKMWTVDAWEKRLRDVDYDGIVFPDKVDTDKDGMVYRIRAEESGELTLLDSAEYTEWIEDLLKGAEEIPIQWKEIHG